MSKIKELQKIALELLEAYRESETSIIENCMSGPDASYAEESLCETYKEYIKIIDEF
jgi:hypothetical protein